MGWHALSPSEGRDLAVCHALRSSGRATQIAQLIFFTGPKIAQPDGLDASEGEKGGAGTVI